MSRFLFASAALACSLAAAALPARADLQYTQEMRMTAQGDKPLSKTTTYLRVGARRVETVFQIGTVEQRSVMLTLCAKKEMYTLDTALKIYYVTPLVKAPTTNAAPPPATKADTKTGTMTMTLVSLKDMGEEAVGDTKTHCYEVVTRMQSSGCLGNTDLTTKQQLCIAPDQNMGGDGGCTDMVAGEAGGDGANECRTVFVRKGDWARYEKLTKGLQVRARTFEADGKDMVQSEMQISTVSHAKLPDSLFELPADFRKVSPQEFQKLQTEAMMKKMTGQTATE